MNIEVKKAYPPNYEQILAAFPLASTPGVIFAYAPYIFCPSGNSIPPSLIDHEAVHIERQHAQGVEAWWDQYLVDEEFRYYEELLAHRAELDKIIEMEGNPSRQFRRAALVVVAKRLHSPIYAHGVSLDEIKRDLKRLAEQPIQDESFKETYTHEVYEIGTLEGDDKKKAEDYLEKALGKTQKAAEEHKTIALGVILP